MNGSEFDLSAVPLTFWLIFASIIALWAPVGRSWLWQILLGLAIIVGYFQSYIDVTGIVIVLALGVATWLLAQQMNDRSFTKIWKEKLGAGYTVSVYTVHIVFLAIAGLLAAHKLPGFNSYLVVGGYTLHEDAEPLTIRFHFDKSVIGLFFLAYCVERVRSFTEWGHILVKIVPIILGSVLPAFVIAFFLGYVKFDPVWSSYILAFTLANLLVTSVAEEVFFRGWMQAGLTKKFKNIRNGHFLAIAVTALLFGAAHLWGGIGLAIGAFLAGLGYGYAYYVTGRIEAAVLAHFAFNGIHFTFFTYPILIQHS